MLILLPPSEGKSTPAAGEPADPAALWLPKLATARKRVLSKLVALSKRTSARAVAESLGTLGLRAGQRGELDRNAGLLTAPAAPAAQVYSGVLYEALDHAALPAEARGWVAERAVVFSGLWGVVRLTDRIPAYRCSAGVVLPGIGGLTPYWKSALTRSMPDDGPVLDLRSGAYAAMWGPPAQRSVALRVLHERVVDGELRRSVVSHFNKATKGRMVRALAVAGVSAADVDELLSALRDLKWTVEERPVAAGRPRQADVIVREL
ncbi:YaaA family protein [Actinoplanes sp. TFC3]|uniref:YaaA family protein n=1 Tax=Actinoplanes sp. TFC3 TaxID=1710355 RepID=UPI00082AE71D|nr:peroxide stress protein YaaA [Actinoplanes sp. TFC3]